MKPKHNQFKALIGLAAAACSASAFAAQIDVTSNPIAPVNTTVGSGVRGVRALITSQTWTKNNEYFLTDRVFIPNGITLTIEPGTKIYSSTNDNGTSADKADDKVGSLIVARGGRLIADGTAAEPIVFTSVTAWEAANNQDSSFDPGTTIGPAPTVANAGLWGGVVMLGNAYINHLNGTTGNVLGNAQIEGFVPSGTPDDDGDGLPDASEYGFDATYPQDNDDDSGIIRYVSIRHGGYEFATGKEINGLTLGGVGAGTVIDHVEVVANQDDGIEFFGGTVSCSHILLAYNQDDNFDFDSGYTGTLQFLFSIQDPGFADGGFEADGVEMSGTASQAGYDAGVANTNPLTAPVLSKPIMYNCTLIGPGRNNTFSTIAVNTGTVLTEKGNHGFIMDDYFNGELYNSVIDDFSQDLILFKDNAKSTGTTARVAHNTVGRFGVNSVTAGTNLTYVTGTNSRNLFYNALGVAQDGNSDSDTNPRFESYTRNSSNFLTAIDPRPASNSPLLKANGATLKSGAPVPVDYRGAFGAQNWAAGWSYFSQLGLLKGTGPATYVDADGDGISDTVESNNSGLGLSPTVSDATVLATLKTAAQFSANRTAGQDDVINSPATYSLYTSTSILDLRTVGQTMVQAGPVNVSLTLPVEKSTGLSTWATAGSMTLSFPKTPGKEFYRLAVEGVEVPN
jgi:hypothetical protein